MQNDWSMNRINNILKGKYLIEGNALKNWGFILFCVVLAMVMIAGSHQMERKVHKIAKLQIQERELRSEFVDQRQHLMQMKMESTINEKLKDKGISITTTAPQKVIVVK